MSIAAHVTGPLSKSGSAREKQRSLEKADCSSRNDIPWVRAYE